MVDYQETVDKVINELDKYDSDREEVIRLTRKLNRASGRGVSKLIREEDYMHYLEQSREHVDKIADLMEDLAHVTSWGLTKSGMEEYCEFEILHAIVNDKPLPDPVSLRSPSWIWITGLGDVIGELRRYMLSKIREDNFEDAETILTMIQDLYDTIVGLEFSKSLVSNLRRKIDIARTLVDKCESDFTNAVIHKQSKSTKNQ